MKGTFVMQKDDQGVWSFTTEALAPDIYQYSFNADGVRILDPMNGDIAPNLLSPSDMVHVPGPSPQPGEDTDIPHGNIDHHFYKSSIIGDNRDYYVYTPPGYDPNGKTLYPVLYLLHGFSDDASGWTAVGKANFILDALIAEGRAKPMIIVMTLGYGVPDFVHQRSPFNNQEVREQNYERFRQALTDEVIPAVEKSYRVAADHDSRAIAGLSMGGAESLFTGLNRLDTFAWVGAFSAGGLGSDYGKAFPKMDASANAKLHLLWIACGTDDRLITPNRELISWLKSKGVQVTPIETPGMHSWMVWRRNLIAFAPLLFRPEGK
ncbi:MAG: alpha/beta hydrolase-fold protein [Acidobacteriota bacterium]|nr:alpha/beta hydrolase-fold protein [Acidobacteriota bacterium]